VFKGKVYFLWWSPPKRLLENATHYEIRFIYMQLHLNVEGDLGLSAPLRSFYISEGSKCTIGRGKNASWSLADPTRFLSTIHCDVISQESGFFIVDRSQNGLIVDGHKSLIDVATPLKSGSLIEIGPYRIRVTIAEPDQYISGANDRTLVDLTRTLMVDSDKTIISPKAGAVFHAMSSTSKIEDKKTPQTNAGTGVSNRTFSTHNRNKDQSTASFVDAFCDGASVNLNSFAGRTDIELAQEMGRTMQKVAHGLFKLTRSVNELRELIGSSQSEDYGISARNSYNNPQHVLQFLLAIDQPGYGRSDEILGDMVSDLIANDHAVFSAMQGALFRLLNELSPTAIETKSGKSFFRASKSAHWDAYVVLWEQLSTQSENGMLDVYLGYFREMYDNKMEGG
jgi:type VI secretion system protein ImpI